MRKTLLATQVWRPLNLIAGVALLVVGGLADAATPRSALRLPGPRVSQRAHIAARYPGVSSALRAVAPHERELRGAGAVLDRQLMAGGMLRSEVLSKWTAYAGLLGFSLLPTFTVWVTFDPVALTTATVVALSGGLLVVAWNVLLAHQLFRFP